MCVIGNPPYSGISSNNGEWISKLIEDYKYVDGVHFNERKHWLNDDYVKFIRYGQHFIEKNQSGVLAFINPHGFLDNPTFRGMRWHLLKTFDKIYTIDLHGNSKKKETAPDGSPDVNVFDIMQGVSINIFIKTGKKKSKELGKVFHFDLYGKREVKYAFLSEKSFRDVAFQELKPDKPNLLFIPINTEDKSKYENGFCVVDIFVLSNVGFVTANDGLNISFNEQEQRNKINDILTLDEQSWRINYNRPKDADSWKYVWAKEDALKHKNNKVEKVSYRPFDFRYTIYSGKSGGLYARPTYQVMQHFLKGENIGLVTARSNKSETCDHFFISKYIMETKCGERTTQSAIFPLYTFTDKNTIQNIEQTSERLPNINIEFAKQIAKCVNAEYVPDLDERIYGMHPEGYDPTKEISPLDILDYIYAVLHSPAYREKYKEFLKIDFPRVPYPKDKETFWKLVELGGEIRQIHLLESPKVEDYITQYPIDGDNMVTKVRFEENYEIIDGNTITQADPKYPMGRVYINDKQFFQEVPKSAWEFYIGGYQPAQKWLKDRKDRKLEFEDILHYQKVIVALFETDSLMKEIDKVDFMES